MRSLAVLASLCSVFAGVQSAIVAGQSVEFRITSPAGLQTCLLANGNSDGATVSVGPCGRVSTFVKAWGVENGGSTTGTGPAGPIRVFGNKCLDVRKGVNQSGTKLQIWTCGENNPNQQFNVNGDGTISWAGKGKCVDVTDGKFDGTQLQIWTCTKNNRNQKFTANNLAPQKALLTLNPQRAHSIPWCLTALNNANGARVVLQLCSGNKPDQQQWLVPLSGFGPTSLFGGTKCLDVRQGKDANGTPLQLWDCSATNPNQKFINAILSGGPNTIQWAHHSRCLNAVDRVDSAPIQLRDCGSGGNQTWSVVTISE